jgi:hypothetical protein
VRTTSSACTTGKRYLPVLLLMVYGAGGQEAPCMLTRLVYALQFTRLNQIYRERQRQLALGIDVLKEDDTKKDAKS